MGNLTLQITLPFDFLASDAMFPWHSTIANQGGAATAGRKSVSDSTHLAMPYRALLKELSSLARNDAGHLHDPMPIIQGLKSMGVILGPKGAGTLLAICDR